MSHTLRLMGWTLAGCLVISGCTVGPDFHSPAQQVADDYSLGVTPQDTAKTNTPGGQEQHFSHRNQLRKDWYKLFASPLLNKLIKKALHNSPNLASSKARLEAVRYQLEAASGASLPDLDLVGNAKRKHGNGAQMGVSGPLINTPMIQGPSLNSIFNFYSPGLRLSYDMDLFGANERKKEAARAEYVRQRQLLKGSRLALIDNLVASVIRYATLNARIAATRSIIEADKEQSELFSKQERIGAINQADVLRARTKLARSQAKLPAMYHQLETLRTTIAALIGADPGSFQLPRIQLQDLRLPSHLPVALSSELLKQRPDILAAEAALHRATAKVGIAKAHLFPDITLSANIGYAANHTGDLFHEPARIWGLGASLFAPIFHGHSLRALDRATRARLKVSQAQYRSTVLNAFKQVINVLDAIKADAVSLKAEKRACDAAKASMQLVRKQYQNGAASYLDLITAERVYNQELMAFLKATGARYLDTAALYHALGGGWWQPVNATNTGENRHGR